MTQDLLLLSTATLLGQDYLEYVRGAVWEFLAGRKTVHFIPWALDDMDGYTSTVQAAMEPMGVTVFGMHAVGDPRTAAEEAEVIFCGGGNSFRLLKKMHGSGVLPIIRHRANAGELSYMGSSAGTNVACPTIRTTNDMPIVQTPSLEALWLIPFQVNPHYLDADPCSTHMGETREQRIVQFLEENDVPVLGLREGAWLRREGDNLTLDGTTGATLFQRNQEPIEYKKGADLSFLLQITPVYDVNL